MKIRRLPVSAFPVILLIATIGLLSGQDREPALQRVYNPYWTVSYGHTSTIQLHNNLIDKPLAVRPVLLSQAGERTELPVVNLTALGNASIEVGPLLERMGRTDLRKGSAIFEYMYPYPGALIAETSVEDPAHTLIYTVIGGEKGAKGSSLYGVYWFPRGGDAEIYVALQNTSDAPVHVSAALMGQAPFAQVTLGPLESQVVETQVPLGRGAANVYGGVVVTHDASENSLITSGWTEMEATGYSNMMTLHDPARHQANRLVGTQIFLGEQRELLGTRGSFKIDSAVVLANVSDAPLTPRAELVYEAGGNMARLPLRVGTLNAGDVAELDLSNVKLPKEALSTGSVVVSYDGPGGALMGRTFGVADKTFGFYGTMESNPPWGVSELYWTTEGDAASLLTVTNFGEQDDKMTVVVTHNGGTVPLPEFALKPLQSVTLNLRQLKERGLVPPGAEFGGFRVFGSSPQTSRLLVKEHVIKQSQGLSVPFYGPPNWVVDWWLSVDYFELHVGQSQFSMKQLLFMDSSVWTEPVPPSLGSSDYDVLTMSTSYPGFYVNAVGPGEASIAGTSDYYPIDEQGTQSNFLFQGDADFVCTIGLANVTLTKGSGATGSVTFKVSNSGCPTGGNVTVGLVTVTQTGTLNVSISSNPSEFPVPASISDTHGFDFTYSGTGNLKFQVSIQECEGEPCGAPKNWERSPNNVQTNEVSFP